MFGNKRGKRNVLDLDNDSDDGSEFRNTNELTINKNYAERYDKWRGSEELQKLKDRYGDKINEDEESSSSSSEEEWTADKEKAFFKTFSLLKKKDPKIYDSNVFFFKSANETGGASTSTVTTPALPATETMSTKSTKKSKKDKSFLLKDHERKMILEKDGLSSDSDSDDKQDTKNKNSDPSYVQQQANIKKGFSEALNTIESDEEGDDYKKSNLLKPRKKSDKEQQEDDEDYRKWLKGKQDEIKSTGNISNELQFLREYWTDPSLNEGEKFLRDYILDRKYQEPDDKSYIPSYDEIVHDSDEEGLSGDEEHVEKMEEFEHKYNFRFEEPDQDFIKRYPRTVETSLRRADEKRKQQRDTIKERKEAEREKKREEIQRMKALKRNEIIEKLKQLQDITGDPSLNFDDEDVEGDFDPEAHDRRMQKIFSEQYYEENEDAEKPVFPFDDELDGEEWKAFCPSDEEQSSDSEIGNSEPAPDVTDMPIKRRSKKNKEGADNVEEPGTSSSSKPKMSVIDELIEASKGKRQNNKKKSSIFLQALERSKPKFDSKAHESFQEYFDEYYKLDFEDLIGDIPCRFKYRTVTPNDFGLTTEEILKVPDRELNQWASVKKTYQYRTAEEEKYDVQAYKQKASNIKQKKKVLPTLFHSEKDGDDEEEEEDEDEQQETTGVDSNNPPETTGKKKKNKKKKKKKKKKTAASTEMETEIDETIEDDANQGPATEPSEVEVTPEPAEAQPKKSKKKKKSGKVEEAAGIEQNSEIATIVNVSDVTDNANLEETQPPQAESGVEGKSKKKKKKKSKSKAEIPAVSDTSSGNNATSVADAANANTNGNAHRGTKRKAENQHQQKQKNKDTSGEGEGAKKRKDNRNVPENKLSIDDERLRAYGINPTKYKKQLKYGNKK